MPLILDVLNGMFCLYCCFMVTVLLFRCFSTNCITQQYVKYFDSCFSGCLLAGFPIVHLIEMNQAFQSHQLQFRETKQNPPSSFLRSCPVCVTLGREIENCLLIIVCMHACCMLSRSSRVQLFVTLWTVARQAPLSMEFSRQEYWSALLQGIFPAQGSNSCLLCVLHQQADSLPLSHLGNFSKILNHCGPRFLGLSMEDEGTTQGSFK